MSFQKPDNKLEVQRVMENPDNFILSDSLTNLISEENTKLSSSTIYVSIDQINAGGSLLSLQQDEKGIHISLLSDGIEIKDFLNMKSEENIKISIGNDLISGFLKTKSMYFSGDECVVGFLISG